MPKTVLDPQAERSLKKIFVESLNGQDTVIMFGHVRLAGGKAVMSRPEGLTDYEVLMAQRGAAPSGYTYSVEYWPSSFIIHSSNSGDTSEISYVIIGK